MISVVKVQSKEQKTQFISLPWKIYKGDSNWVPPLVSMIKKQLDPQANPFFRESRAQLFLAYDGHEVVGRIAAIYNSPHLKKFNDGVGFFGFFESINDSQVSTALFDAAKEWLLEQGLNIMRGPMSFTINDECGLLIDAFDQMPVLMMPYNPDYYPALFEAYGLSKIEDLYAYLLELPGLDERSKRGGRHARYASKNENPRITSRPIDMKQLDREIAIFERAFNESWQDNWGAIDITTEEFREIVIGFKDFVVPELVHVFMYDGEPAGVLMGFPDLNPAIQKLNGRMRPLGMIKFLLAKRKINRFRIVLLGIYQKFRGLGIESYMFNTIFEDFPKQGYPIGEASWILESNRKMRVALERMGVSRYKTYRVYDKSIS